MYIKRYIYAQLKPALLLNASILGLKRIVSLVFKYSFGFQTNILNILFTRRSDKMAILSDKITIILVE